MGWNRSRTRTVRRKLDVVGAAIGGRRASAQDALFLPDGFTTFIALILHLISCRLDQDTSTAEDDSNLFLMYVHHMYLLF
jgi:hypothetical protein